MTKFQSLKDLRAEMKTVARGERHAPRDAGGISYSSIEALGRLLTRDNRALLATIRDRNPRSVAELSRISGRAESNLARTLRKLEVAGLVKFTRRGRNRVPVATAKPFIVRIDPYGETDRFERG